MALRNHFAYFIPIYIFRLYYNYVKQNLNQKTSIHFKTEKIRTKIPWEQVTLISSLPYYVNMFGNTESVIPLHIIIRDLILHYNRSKLRKLHLHAQSTPACHFLVAPKYYIMTKEVVKIGKYITHTPALALFVITFA